jgi:hypothetical protein
VPPIPSAKAPPPVVPVPPFAAAIAAGLPTQSLAPPPVPDVPAPRDQASHDRNGGDPHGVHPASYREFDNARRGWDQLTHRNEDLLRGLDADIRKVEVDGKGACYRLYAVPVANAEAAALCEKLRSRGVFCEPQG